VVGGDPIRFLPVHIGYDLVHNPVKTWFFYSAVPNIYAEVSVSAFLPVIKPSLVCDLDFYGVGLRAEAGAYAGWLLQWQAYLYASAQIRLLTFGIKF